MGITSDFKKDKLKNLPPVKFKPDNSDRGHMTKAEAIADNDRIRNAREKAAELESKLLADRPTHKATKPANVFKKPETKTEEEAI